MSFIVTIDKKVLTEMEILAVASLWYFMMTLLG